MAPKKTTEQFIKDAKKTHGDKFDYSETIYTRAIDYVTIICNACSRKFQQNALSHIRGAGCSSCNGGLVSNTAEFIRKAELIHEYNYDYSEVKYKNNEVKIKIYCGWCDKYFMQTPANHLTGQGCDCYRVHNLAEFTEKATKVHEGKYTYNKVNYIGSRIKVEIFCVSCDKYFMQTTANHLMGQGCITCGGHEQSNTSDFIKKARTIHGDKYSYEKVNYIKAINKVTIKCIACDCEFNQSPNAHLCGIGCPYCHRKTEAKLYKWLLENYNTAKIIKECIFVELPNARFDFYLEDYDLVIELDGLQHFKQVFTWQDPAKTQDRDKKKMDFCIENGLSVIRILQEDVFKDKYDWQLELKAYIKKYKTPSIRMLERGNLYDVFSEYYDYEPDMQY